MNAAIMISVETLKCDDYSSATPSTLEKHYPRGLKRSEGEKKKLLTHSVREGVALFGEQGLSLSPT